MPNAYRVYCDFDNYNPNFYLYHGNDKNKVNKILNYIIKEIRNKRRKFNQRNSTNLWKSWIRTYYYKKWSIIKINY